VRKAQYFRNKNFLLENPCGTGLQQVPDWSAAHVLSSCRPRDPQYGIVFNVVDGRGQPQQGLVCLSVSRKRALVGLGLGPDLARPTICSAGCRWRSAAGPAATARPPAAQQPRPARRGRCPIHGTAAAAQGLAWQPMGNSNALVGTPPSHPCRPPSESDPVLGAARERF
jgi:hypothetical protein